MKEKKDQPQQRCCLNCGTPLAGRPDKLFCSSRCKNGWHNRLNGAERRRRDRVCGILWKNYKLLELVLDLGTTRAEMHSLTDMGFCPGYMTGHSRARGARDLYHCFDISYNMTEARLYNIRRASDPGM